VKYTPGPGSPQSGLASTGSIDSGSGQPVLKRVISGSLATTWPNLVEWWVGSKIAAWLNEWGGLRGTSPYAWGDALVRAIRTATDGITGAGSAIELVDRRSAGESNTMWGLGWDGTVRIGGTDTVPEGVATVACVLVDNGAPAPTGLPDGTLIFERA
jgi:hypothetical protein